MAQVSVRIKKITIRNFKNVAYGSISLVNNRKKYNASILGLYGQNGSGKTALIDAVQILKYALCGSPVPEKFVDCININADSSNLEFELTILKGDIQYNVWYSFTLGKLIDTAASNSNDVLDNGVTKSVIQGEKLAFSQQVSSGRAGRKTILIDTDTPNVLIPRTKYSELIGKDSGRQTDLLVAKKYAFTTSRSFIFSRELLNAIRQNCTNETYHVIMEALVKFGNRELFIINTENTGLVSLNIIPLSFKYSEGTAEAFGNIPIPLSKPTTIPQQAFSIVEKVVANMNIVLKEIVPGLTIKARDLGPSVLKSGQAGQQIQMMSLKNGREIPLQYESDGIKRIISMLQLLIVVFNNSSITVAIDELDDGIFEYLLGELLRIISEKGKGQLIFTSHNLRPLETIDKCFVAFTTTNSENRYTRITGVKGNNNLRDLYYRDIVLGGQQDPLYEHTNNSRIALAFRKAGEAIGT